MNVFDSLALNLKLKIDLEKDCVDAGGTSEDSQLFSHS